MNIKFSRLITFGFFFLFAINSYATEWIVDLEQSQLNFVSIKKTHIAEVHTFNTFQGALDKQGQFELTIDLASADTQIEIRNNRLGEFLFEIEKYTTASLTGAIDAAELVGLDIEKSKLLVVEAKLNLHGKEKTVTLNLLVTKLSESKLLVTSAKPVLINVADFSLVAGVEKLRELAKLSSISYTVPVSFHLVHDQTKQI